MHRATVWQERNSNTKIVHNSTDYILWNLLSTEYILWNLISLVWLIFTNSVLQVPSEKIVSQVEILGIGWPGVIG